MQVSKVIETSLYVRDLDASRKFYSEILGLKEFSSEKNRHVFFRCGDAMFLLFNPHKTRESGQNVPSHGAEGAGHVAFSVAEKEHSDWKNYLLEKGVVIEKEIQWPGGGKSIYFRDPSGNSIELVTPQTWGMK
jgi:catechol 2,3-dioxygenase-like lactoylglutathione lyase family enzyme